MADRTNLGSLLAVQRCITDGDLGPVLKEYSAAEFNRANLSCASALRNGDMELAREYAYAAKAIEAFPEDFKRFVEKEMQRAQS